MQGTRVRLIANPSRVGVVIGEPKIRADKKKYQVQFSDGPNWHSESQLEAVDDTLSDALELFEQGRLGRAKDLRSNLTYVRLNGRLADVIYSMETTNTDFYPYQFKPVLNFLNSPSNSILIADEVGLGKTIEAGLIWTELRSRFGAKRLMVVCPAMLRDKWQFELENRFGIQAEILDAADTFKKLQQDKGNAFAIVGSMQGLRPRRDWDNVDEPVNGISSDLGRFLEESAYQEPLIDLLIIDEAHYMRNQESMTSQLGKSFRRVSEHVVLLSATPINLKSRDLYQLLNLVDEDTFNQPHVFDDILTANEPIIKAREAVLARELTQHEFVELIAIARNHYLLQSSRQLKEFLTNPPTTEELHDNKFRSELADRLEKLNLLNHSVTRTRKREVHEWRVVRVAVPEYIAMTVAERDLYDTVTEIISAFCLERKVPKGFLLVTPQRQLVSSMPAALRAWQQKKFDYAEYLYEDIGVDEFDDIDLGPLVQKLASISDSLGDYDELRCNDSKYQRLRDMLTLYFSEFPDEKIILFSYFRPTLSYLNERLTEDGISSAVLMGGMKTNKQELIQQFKENCHLRVLLASEVASEGVDLQFCRVVINYDLPWNPMKVEQRIGRIDRIGQQSEKITIWNLFYKDTIDARIYERLFERLGIFEQALGGLEMVIGDEIQKLTTDLMFQKLSNEQQESRIEQTAQALANIKNQEEQLEEQANNLIAHGEYILNQVKAAKELNRIISAGDLYYFVRDFIIKQYPGCELKQLNENDLIFDISLSPKAKVDLDDFLKRNRLYSQTKLAANQEKWVRCIFKNKVASHTSPGMPEIISQFHPLTRFISCAIKQQNESFYPAVSIKLNHINFPELPVGVYVFYVQKWSLEALRDIERLYFVAKPLFNNQILDDDISEKLITIATLHGRDWIEAKSIIDLPRAAKDIEDCMAVSDDKYDEFVKQIENENEDRAELQERSLLLHRDKQIAIQQEVKLKHEQAIRDIEIQLTIQKDGKLKLERYRKKRYSLVKATEGKIAKIKESVAIKLAAINKRRKISHYGEEICLGIIKIE
jgi:superfamily II DNA or RNA helicase